MWKEIKIDNDIYTISTEFVDGKWKIMLTNLIDLWIEILSMEEIIEKYKNLNPMFAIEAVDIDEIIQKLFDKIPQVIAEPVKVTKIKLETIVEGGIVKFEIDLKKGNSRQLWQEVTLPLCISVAELNRQKDVLISEVEKRDEEIFEYRACGAELVREYIQTIPYTSDIIEGEVPIYSISCCIEVFKSVINNVDILKAREKFFKSEDLGEHGNYTLSLKASSSEVKYSDSDDYKKRTESENTQVVTSEGEAQEMGTSLFRLPECQADGSSTPSPKRKRGRCAFCPRSCDLKTTATCSNCPLFVCQIHRKTLCITCVSKVPASPSP